MAALFSLVQSTTAPAQPKALQPSSGRARKAMVLPPRLLFQRSATLITNSTTPPRPLPLDGPAELVGDPVRKLASPHTQRDRRYIPASVPNGVRVLRISA